VGQAATKDDAMMEPAMKARNVIAFGPFSLDASRRLLLKNDSELGARTPDILIELVSRPNEVVSKNDLLAQVWPGAPVEKGSLRFHIFGLRNRDEAIVSWRAIGSRRLRLRLVFRTSPFRHA
jgi:DNA-binding response OmpR family regulator